MVKAWKEFSWYKKFSFSLLLAIGFVAVWRGIWYLLDIVLLPNSQLLSAILSIAIGVSMFALAHRKFM